MPWLEALSDPFELRRCIRDLVALSTLPAIWRDYDPRQIADSVALALVTMGGADFIYVQIPDEWGQPSIEVFRAGETIPASSTERLHAMLRSELPARGAQRLMKGTHPNAPRSLRLP